MRPCCSRSWAWTFVSWATSRAWSAAVEATWLPAWEVAQETKVQAKDLLQQGRTQLRQQAVGQQHKAAEGLQGLAQQLRGMAQGNAPAPGPARDLVEQVTDRVEEFATWLQHREPADLLDEVRSFARRKPGTFLLGAALAGVLAGRLTSGVKAVHSNGSATTGGSQYQTDYTQTGYTQTDYVAPAPAYTGYAETTTYETTTGYGGTAATGSPVPPPPYGTVPPTGAAVPPTTPAGWDDPTRRPGQGV